MPLQSTLANSTSGNDPIYPEIVLAGFGNGIAFCRHWKYNTILNLADVYGMSDASAHEEYLFYQ